MKPTLRQLQYLVAIADAGSFSRAAKQTHVSQPSLSKQVKDMESVLGIKLVERGRGGAPLTPIGVELAARARIILRDMDWFKTLAREAGQTFSGKIRLGTLASIGPYLLPLAMRNLHKAYPELRIFVREERTLDLHSDLESGRLDVIISTPEDHAGMKEYDLFEEQLYVGVAPDDPLGQSNDDILLSELKGRELLSLGYGHKLAIVVQRIAELAGGHISAEYEGTSLDAIRQMAEMGGAVAVMPSLYCFSEAFEDPGIIVRKIDHKEARRDISLMWRPTSPLTEKFTEIGSQLRLASEQLLSNQR